MKQHICLFDMDGTLTEPREAIDQKMIETLQTLSGYSEVGIVTGSDLDYVKQQCEKLFLHPETNLNRFLLFPCNGTKSYEWSFDLFDWEEKTNANMIDNLGQEKYNRILQSLYSYQLMIVLAFPQLSYTGTFFQYRGSMLNWCPVGRSAGHEERKSWVDADHEYKIRDYWIDEIKKLFVKEEAELTVAMGGSTSFDIYPDGWDKTYVMNHLDQYSTVYFVGDRCQEGGNDKALYDLLVDDELAFETHNTEQTIEIISKIIGNIKNKVEKDDDNNAK